MKSETDFGVSGEGTKKMRGQGLEAAVRRKGQS